MLISSTDPDTAWHKIRAPTSHRLIRPQSAPSPPPRLSRATPPPPHISGSSSPHLVTSAPGFDSARTDRHRDATPERSSPPTHTWPLGKGAHSTATVLRCHHHRPVHRHPARHAGQPPIWVRFPVKPRNLFFNVRPLHPSSTGEIRNYLPTVD